MVTNKIAEADCTLTHSQCASMHQVSSSPVGGRNADSFSETRMVIKMLFHLAVTFMQCSVSDLIVSENQDLCFWLEMRGLRWCGGCNLSFFYNFTFYNYHLVWYIWNWIYMSPFADLVWRPFQMKAFWAAELALWRLGPRWGLSLPSEHGRDAAQRRHVPLVSSAPTFNQVGTTKLVTDIGHRWWKK